MKRSCAMPRQRRWQPNNRLVYERERRGWSQDDAAREAERVADRLGQPDLVFTAAQLGRWERGEHRPRPPYLRVVCELYQASAEALGLCDPPGAALLLSSAADTGILLPSVGLVPAGRSGDAVSSLATAFQAVAPATQDQEVTTTDRREAMKHMIAVGAGLVGDPCLPMLPMPQPRPAAGGHCPTSTR
jgi:transcriptional regulator with XRE-family HTH domain